jgi:hypothetical protein
MHVCLEHSLVLSQVLKLVIESKYTDAAPVRHEGTQKML